MNKGQIIDNRFKIIKELGQGGFGTVFLVHDKNLDQKKAIKIISKEFYNDLAALEILKKEAQTMFKIVHQNVIRFFDIHLIGEIKYIDMEFVDGLSLDILKIRQPENRFSEDVLIDIALQTAEGLKAIHSAGIIHRDIKPNNILINEKNQIKIMDFGISEHLRTNTTRIKNSDRAGSPVYMSPEQLIGKNVGKESDIWSYGVMLFELASGRKMFTGTSREDVLFSIKENLDVERDKKSRQTVQHGKPDYIEYISKELNELIESSVQYDYKNRFSSFNEIIEKLKDLKKIDHLSRKHRIEIISKLKEKGFKNEQLDKFIGIVQEKYGNLDKSIVESILNSKRFIQGNEQKDDSFEIRKNIKEKCRESSENMILIKGKPFQMGSDSAKNPPDEQPKHLVSLDSYYINKFVVTFDEYDLYCEENNIKKPQSFRELRENYPVINVSWYDACLFCNWRSKIEGFSPAYKIEKKKIICDFKSGGYRLPTEAEWEYAARGGEKSKGFLFSGSNELKEIGWYKGNSMSQPQKIGLKNPNELGLFDMSGNVLEWCWDLYSKDFYKNSPLRNPVGPFSGSGRVLRGGSWYHYKEFCRSCARSSYDKPNKKTNYYGFRLARTVK